MKKIAVATLIKKLSLLSEHCMQGVMNSCEGLSESQMQWQPNERTWSVAQCIEHLNAYHRYYNPVFLGKIANTRFKD